MVKCMQKYATIMEAYNCHHLNISFREKFRENNGGFHENRKIL
jgi:hypothetical protein